MKEGISNEDVDKKANQWDRKIDEIPSANIYGKSIKEVHQWEKYVSPQIEIDQ